MLASFSLDGKVAFVTGAGSGIGASIAQGWAEAGAAIACFDVSADAAEGTAKGLRSNGHRAIAISGDVTDETVVQAAVAHTVDELGGLDIALNSAGIGHNSPAEEMSPTDWRHVVDVNLTGVFLSAQAEARIMLQQGAGSIVNVGSMSGRIVSRGANQAHYNASKAGVVHLTKALAVEWATSGVRVNAISPGYTLTPLTDKPEIADLHAAWKAQTPMKRMVQVEELVGPATFLASDASSACTGIDLIVDCGFVCW